MNATKKPEKNTLASLIKQIQSGIPPPGEDQEGTPQQTQAELQV